MAGDSRLRRSKRGDGESLLPRGHGSNDDQHTGQRLKQVPRRLQPSNNFVGDPKFGSLLAGNRAVARSCKLTYGTPLGAGEHV